MFYAAIPFVLDVRRGPRRPPRDSGVLVTAVAVDLLIESVTWPPLMNLYDYFTYPAAIFYQRVLLGHASRDSAAAVSISRPNAWWRLAVLLVALAWTLAARRSRTARPAAGRAGRRSARPLFDCRRPTRCTST